MSIQKLPTLVNYSNQLQSKLADKAVPEKHKNREGTYRQFLERELKTVNAKIEELKLSLPSKK